MSEILVELFIRKWRARYRETMVFASAARVNLKLLLCVASRLHGHASHRPFLYQSNFPNVDVSRSPLLSSNAISLPLTTSLTCGGCAALNTAELPLHNTFIRPNHIGRPRYNHQQSLGYHHIRYNVIRY